MIDNSKEYILCAAIKRKQPRNCTPYYPNTNDICNIELGYRHHDIFHRFDGEMSECEQGFYTSKGRYVDRYEAMEIAYNAGQVSEIIAFHKSNMKLNATDVNGNPIDWDALDKHKFNMLFSEDLY
jgi:hypothetical protein